MSNYFSTIFKEISKNAGELTVSFSKFDTNKLLQDKRKLSSDEKKQVDKALKIREQFGFSFWEAIMSTYFDQANNNFSFLNDALNHHTNSRRTSFSSENLVRIENFLELHNKENIALVSKVKQQTKWLHIPMIDFHIPPSPHNLIVVEEVLKALNLNSGYIINSGKSYHFIGSYLITEKELLILLTKMFFFAPIIDRNWIIHQILEKKCAVRITQGTKIMPVIVKYIS